MSKSLKRVRAVLEPIGAVPFEMERPTRTAEDAAREIGCKVDQIAKSIIFKGSTSQQALLFVTAGGRQVDTDRAVALAGEQFERADAAFVRAETGFAIGGVAPVGHIKPVRTFVDAYLMEFDVVYAAAGTPHHIFAVAPQALQALIGSQPIDFSM